MSPTVVATPITAIKLPLESTELLQSLDGLTRIHGPLDVTTADGLLVLFTKGKRCGCGECDEKLGEVLSEHTHFYGFGMIICESCGNKRCPHASSHRYACTKSNEFGQTPVLVSEADG